MQAWTYLKPGDVIDIVAPGYGGTMEDLKVAEKIVRTLGFTPRIKKGMFAKHPLHASEDAFRLQHFKEALLAKDSKAIWCYKGGYGTAKLLPDLLKMSKPRQPKILIGFSDITALHLLCNQHWHWPSLHAPVLWQLVKKKVDAASIQKLKQTLLGKQHTEYFSLKAMNKAARIKRYYTGIVRGGNLGLLQCSLGTDWQVKAENTFLVIEDIDEKAYRIDRELLHLKQAGVFEKVKVVLFGDFTYDDKEEEEKIARVVHAFAESLKIPAVYIEGVGHGKKNYPLPLGTPAILHLTDRADLEVQHGAIS